MKVFLTIVCSLYLLYRIGICSYKTYILLCVKFSPKPFFVFLGTTIACIIEGFCWYYIINQIIN